MNQYLIYPKQFKQKQYRINANKCFVLMPFRDDYNKLYGIIKDELSKLNILCLRDDEIHGARPFMNKVLTEIISSKYLIVILTDYRPNVLYELGIAHCFKEIDNILILIDKKSNFINSIHSTFSDISHLTYVQYDIENTMLIRSEIADFINKNRSTTNLCECLYSKGIFPLVNNCEEDFCLYIKEKFLDSYELVIDILMGIDISIVQKINILELCNNILYNEIDISGNHIDFIIKIFAELLMSIGDLEICNEMIKSFITDEMIRGDIIKSESLVNQWKIDFIIYLAERNSFLNTLLPWIINYFKKTKSSTIDLNRYKLENYLVKTNNPRVNEAISNALNRTDFHIREHLSDIVGEKKLYMARPNLIIALENESNLYAGKSIIVALGKLGSGDDFNTAISIISWLEKNIKKIINSGIDFTDSILTKSKVAINNIYPAKIKEFDEKFSKLINNANY